MSFWALFGIVFASSIVLIALIVLLGKLFWRGPSRAPEWEAWKKTAAGLPMRDRLALYWSTSRGRAIRDPRLAALAVQRGEAAAALLGAAEKPSVWLWRGLAVLWAALAVFGFLAQITIWQSLTYVVFAALALAMPLLQRADRRRVQRSVAANRRPAATD